MKMLSMQRWSHLINIFCFVIAVTVAGVFLLKPMHAIHRGFFCDDVTIRYPYRGNTISVPLLVVTCFLPAVFTVLILETVYGILTARFTTSAATITSPTVTKDNHHHHPHPHPHHPTPSSQGSGLPGLHPGSSGSNADSSTCWEGLRSGLARGGVFTACLFYGNCLCYSLTEVFKLSFGTLRPSFLDACRPLIDVTALPNCSAPSSSSSSSSSVSGSWFVEDVQCLNEDEKLMIDMRKSFVSGHSSFAAFNLLFIMLYLQRRLPLSTPRLLVALLQTVCAGYAIFVCATRIWDHYHHPTDVIGGALLGVVCCWVTMFKICPSVICHPPRAEMDLLPSQGPSTKQGTSLQLTSVTSKD